MAVAVLALAGDSDLDGGLDLLSAEADLAGELETRGALAEGSLSGHAEAVSAFSSARGAESVLGDVHLLVAEVTLDLEASGATEVGGGGLSGEAQVGSAERAVNGGGLVLSGSALVAEVLHATGADAGGSEGSLELDLALLLGDGELGGLGHVSGGGEHDGGSSVALSESQTGSALSLEHALADVGGSAVHGGVLPAASLGLFVAHGAGLGHKRSNRLSELALASNESATGADLDDSGHRVGLALTTDVVGVRGAELLRGDGLLNSAAGTSGLGSRGASSVTRSGSQALTVLEHALLAEESSGGSGLAGACLADQFELRGAGVDGCRGLTTLLGGGEANEGKGNKGSHGLR